MPFLLYLVQQGLVKESLTHLLIAWQEKNLLNIDLGRNLNLLVFSNND